MKPKEIVELVKKEDPKLFADMPDKKIAQIVRAAFGQVGKQLDATTEGAMKVPGLGNFRVRQGEREKDGQKVPVKRVTFRRAKQEPGARKRGKKARDEAAE
jgi:hypothetical protein